LGFSSDEMVEFQPNFSEKEQPVPVLVAKVVPYIDLEKLKNKLLIFFSDNANDDVHDEE